MIEAPDVRRPVGVPAAAFGLQPYPRMQIDCPHCHAVLEYTNRPPTFCGYCGKALSTAGPEVAAPAGPPPSATVDYDAEAATLPPPACAAGAEGDDPETVGGYRLLRELGSGGMGKVYEAEEIASGRRVALKLVSAQYATSREAVERFRREGRLAGTVAHPRCVFVYATDEEAGRPYIVMELMTGRTLHDVVKEKGPLPVEEAVAQILDVIDGLHAAHQLGVVHRDVKPSNCFLDAEGRVKVGDFGLSKSLVSDTHLTKTGSFMGTALFASPEQIRADPVDQQTDVYSVAATLYHLLTGQAPFQTGDAAATMARIVADDPPPMRSRRPDLPAALDRVVLRGLQRDRGRRWRDLAEFRAALRPFLPAKQTAASPGYRLGAHLIDWTLVMLVSILVWVPYHMWYQVRHGEAASVPGWLYETVWLSLWFAYFLFFEGVGDRSLGKRLLGLRIARAQGGEPPTFGQALLRTGAWFALVPLPSFAADLLSGFTRHESSPAWKFFLVGLMIGTRLMGIALLCGTMRARNGWRGLHDWASGTRVLQDRGEAGPGPFAKPAPPVGAVGPLGRRLLAFLLDLLVFFPVLLFGDRLTQVLLGQPEPPWLRVTLQTLTPNAILLIYFALTEGLLGWSVGKLALRLRVRRTDGATAPGLARALIRTAVFFALTVPTEVLQAVLETQMSEELAMLSSLGIIAVEVLVTCSTMRARNGWRGPHEFLSGTRVVALPWAPPRGAAFASPDPLVQALSHPPELPSRVGPFTVLGALHWSGDAQLLLAEDRALTRRVCVHLRSQAEGPVPPVPRDIPRPTRLRWLGSGVQGAYLWDAFVCPAGRPLADLVADAPLTWAEARPLLWQLGEELAAACADGTLPEWLSPGQVWVTPDGRLQLVGTPLGPLAPQTWGTDDERALSLLGQVAALALEGQPRRPEDRGKPVRQPLPRHAGELVEPLVGVRNPPRSVAEWLTRFRAVLDRPAAVPLRQRAAHLALQAVLLCPGLAFMFSAATILSTQDDPFDWAKAAFIYACPALWVAWAFATRGGLTYRLMGLTLVRADGRPASRLRCGVRAFLLWAPVTALSVLAYWLSHTITSGNTEGEWSPGDVVAMGCGVAPLGLLLIHVVLALVWPAQSVPDRLAGTYLMPD
jgi:uncharacterized RDD family membrane protein YckC